MRKRVQAFGRTLSVMIMPNIGAFIAWGLLAAIFIPTGWWPNETIAQMVNPMLRYLLPILIAYTAGKAVADHRGGVIGAVATMGVIVGSDIPMFIGAMIMGPLAAYIIKKFDSWSEKYTKAGFELLVRNFSLGIIGVLLAILGFFVIGKLVVAFTYVMAAGVNWAIEHSLLPLVAVFVEPAKILFLNNAINHGIFSPLGIEQSYELGRSIVFLIETNPGPGLGVLLAYWLLGKGTEKLSAPGAAIIHFFGGIHEIYFPYVLSRPILLLSTIAGSASALLYFSLTNSGLVAPASPGSIIAYVAMAPKGTALVVAGGVLLSTIVSFLVAMPFIRTKSVEEKEEEDSNLSDKKISKGLVVFACDAGMGSSALGASRFGTRLRKEGIDLKVAYYAADSLPPEAKVVVCQRELYDRVKDVAQKNCPNAEIVAIHNFLSDPNLDALLEALKTSQNNVVAEVQEDVIKQEEPATEPSDSETSILKLENIRLGLAPCTKEEAIRMAGGILVESGYVLPEYVDAMLEREKTVSTYMGMGLAIPHGTSEAKSKVLKSGIVVLQFPEGVDYGDEKAHLIIGIAGVGDEHLDILSNLSGVLEDEAVLEEVIKTSDTMVVYNYLK